MIVAFCSAFLITFYAVPFLSAFAIRLRFLDVPDGSLKQQKQPVPYLGGVAVYLGFVSAFVLTFPVSNSISFLVIGTTLLLLLGLFDDFFVLRAHQKFLGQIIVALVFLKNGFYLKEQFFLNYWNIPLSLLWMLTIINAFNLVDVMDGLATLLAICASLTFLILAFYFQLPAIALFLTILLGALSAFFYYNRPAATIYLGDAGSLFIGGTLATIPFLFPWGTHALYGYLAPVIILAIPLLEVTTLVLVRLWLGIPFYWGSPDHFSHYLLAQGWSKVLILQYVAALSLFLGLVAFGLVANIIPFWAICLLGVLFTSGWFRALLPEIRKKVRHTSAMAEK
jgi:UDP-GlcNAc:undecaprenyl-phosphate GlcNAc-1-phosphate transferase